MMVSLSTPGGLPASRRRFRVAPLLLALACGAGEEAVDGPPSFNGAAFPNGNTAPLAPAAPGVAPSGNTAPAPSGSGGAPGTPSSNEPATSGVGLNPPAPTQGGQQGSASAGAGGAPQQPAMGAAGAAGAMAPPPSMGNAGSAAMPPVTPPPVTPPPVPNADCADLFFCDDFEDVAAGASPNPALWQVIDGYAPRDASANVQVSAGMAHGGSRAVRVLASGSRNGIVAELEQQSYFIRAWLNLDSVPQGPVLIGVGADQNDEVRLRLWSPSWATVNVAQGDAVRPNGATAGNCPSCVTLMPNRWFCAEMQIDDATRSARLWIDGVEAANLPNGDGGVPAQPATPVLFLGSMGLQGGQTGVWIDDVAAGAQRIGCD